MTDPSPPTSPPQRAPARATTGERIGAGVFASGCAGVLGLAAWLSPSGDGHGTHTQIGLPDCAWVQLFDKPCPTCGMTTSFAHTADASYLTAAATQPLGFLLALGAATAFWAGAHTALTGSRSAHVAMHAVNGRALLVLLGLGLAAWAYKLATWGG
ncbi:MAG: hypothetical protein DHS20C14_04860 [Phycisphaeraceae bacterium]|nr:MAG: hypothetical protein DHS20C14_04860 [Phycisphaeraceae bacterium]